MEICSGSSLQDLIGYCTLGERVNSIFELATFNAFADALIASL